MTATVLSVAWDVVTIVAVVCIVCTSLFLYLTWEDINFSAKDTEGRQTSANRRDANGGRSNPSPAPPRGIDHSSHPPDLLEDIHWDWVAPYGTVLSGGRKREERHRRG